MFADTCGEIKLDYTCGKMMMHTHRKMMFADTCTQEDDDAHTQSSEFMRICTLEISARCPDISTSFQ